MTVPTTIVGSYLPWLTRHLHQQAPGQPVCESFPAAALFADISGFTPLAEQLAVYGPVGAERLSALLNAYFETLIDLVVDYGGDVVKFAGDALLALWPTIATAESLAQVTQRAAACALAVQAHLAQFKANDDSGLRLALKLSLGAGDILAAQLGGYAGHWTTLVVGHPLRQLGTLSAQARPGKIAVSTEAWALLHGLGLGHPLSHSGWELTSLQRPPPCPPLSPLPPSPQKCGGKPTSPRSCCSGCTPTSRPGLLNCAVSRLSLFTFLEPKA